MRGPPAATKEVNMGSKEDTEGGGGRGRSLTNCGGVPDIGRLISVWVVQRKDTFDLAAAGESRDYIALPWPGKRRRAIDDAYRAGAEAACVAGNDI